MSLENNLKLCFSSYMQVMSSHMQLIQHFQMFTLLSLALINLNLTKA